MIKPCSRIFRSLQTNTLSNLLSNTNTASKIMSGTTTASASYATIPKSQPKISSSLLKLGKLNHVAIATPDLAKASHMYRHILGAEVSSPEDLPAHGVTTVFVNLGNTKIELLHPLGDKSPIQKFLDKNKDGGIHHICIEVKDVYGAVSSLKESKQIRILDPEPKIGAHGKPVVFLHPKDCGGVLVELEQE